MSEASSGLRLYNTLTRSKETFVPIDPDNVRMYVCGPTVYDFAHIGNARPVIVFDVLFRLLRHIYGEEHVTYVRNITDVDDKINARALRDFGGEIEAGRLTLNEAIRKVTEPTYDQYQKDVAALGCLPPTFQPRATDFVLPRPDGRADMVTLIQRLIERGHAYETNGEVLFDTASMADYGRLSRRNLDEQQAGARIAIDAHKKNPQDFVLWKLSSPEEPGWESPWGRGRPGWHIECSAMSAAYLGDVFDIHGGGLDLIFPHHENEIAQSRCAHGTHAMANVWMHNGFLQVEGKKMSKSDGNFVTINELLYSAGFGGSRWRGEVVRLAMLKSNYRQPIDWTARLLQEAESNFDEFVRLRFSYAATEPSEQFLSSLLNDLNTKEAIDTLLDMAAQIRSGNHEIGGSFVASLNLMGFLEADLGQRVAVDWGVDDSGTPISDAASIYRATLEFSPLNAPCLIALRRLRRATLPDGRPAIGHRILELLDGLARNADESALIGDVFGDSERTVAVNEGIARRLAFIAAKNWADADRIRDELLAEGIQLKDGKDPVTGERVTTWEVKR